MRKPRNGTIAMTLLATGFLSLATLGCSAASGVESNRTPIVITPSVEEAWGQEAYKGFKKNRTESDDVDLAIRVSRVGRRVAAVSDRPDHPFLFVLLKGSELQAHSFPGRTVCVTEALARHLATDDELAFVLGHELAHITLRHHIYQLRMQEAIEREGSGGKAMLDTVKGLFDRDSEFEADRFGTLYAVRAGYAYSATYAALDSIGNSTHGKQRDAHHPSFAERVELIKKFEKELRLALDAFRRGVKAHTDGDFEQAIELYHLFRAEFPTSVKGLLNLGGAHLSLVHRNSGSPGGLAVVLLPILRDPGIRLRAPLDSSALDAAEGYFAHVLQIRPDEALAEAGLGLVETGRRSFDTARYHLEQAREREPFNPDFTLCLGNVEYMAGNFAVAIGYYEEALVQRPDWTEAKKNLDMAIRMLV
jgi:predicted Zn-dependent protease